MSKLKAKILAWLADDDTQDTPPAQSTAPSDITPEQGASDTTDDVHGTAESATDDTADDLLVYETTPAQIDAWHVWKDFYTLRNFLYQHDWIWYHKILSYDEFKVGLDRNKTCQRATFAIDDSGRYLAFEFDEKTGQAKDYAYACRVLAKINSRRNLYG